MILQIAISVVMLALSAEGPNRQALTHVERGNAAALAGEIATAIREYETAYRLVPSPAVLYNLGQMYEAAERPADALDAFRRCVKTAPADPDAELAAALADARGRITVLEAALGARGQPAGPPALRIAPPPETAIDLRPPPPREAPRVSRTRLWIALGALTAVAATTAILIYARKGSSNDCPDDPGDGFLGCL